MNTDHSVGVKALMISTIVTPRRQIKPCPMVVLADTGAFPGLFAMHMLETSESEVICLRHITMRKSTQTKMDSTRRMLVGREITLPRPTLTRTFQSIRLFTGRHFPLDARI